MKKVIKAKVKTEAPKRKSPQDEYNKGQDEIRALEKKLGFAPDSRIYVAGGN